MNLPPKKPRFKGEIKKLEPEREEECLANCFQSKIGELVSGKLSKRLYIHGYTNLITSSALNECLLVHNALVTGPPPPPPTRENVGICKCLDDLPAPRGWGQ